MSKPIPTPSPTAAVPPQALERAQRLLARGTRCILGIAAPPGAGKSTLAEALARALGAQAQVVPMDGFHLANSELQRLGRAQRKGAADTFDAAGYCHLLQRLRNPSPGETVYAPSYLRGLEEAVAGAIAVPDSTQLVITEGNYLLLDDPQWASVRGLLDETWYLDVDETLRNQRLLARHMQFGRSREDALAWIDSTDAPNTRRIAASRARADWVVGA
jgi:pantothenate kinase